jgi:hypothetical protein
MHLAVPHVQQGCRAGSKMCRRAVGWRNATLSHRRPVNPQGDSCSRRPEGGISRRWWQLANAGTGVVAWCSLDLHSGSGDQPLKALVIDSVAVCIAS